MPNRVLRDWTDSYRIEKLTSDGERFFTRLIMKADDYGRYHADPRLLRAACFPLLSNITDGDISAWLAQLATAGLILPYEVGGRKYLVILEFRQRTRQEASKFPPPDGFSDDWVPGFSDALPVNGRSIDGQLRTGDGGVDEDGDGGGSVGVPPPAADLTPPVFEPLSPKLFRRELEGMLKDCDAEIKHIRQRADCYQWALHKDARELIEFLSKEKREGWEAKVADVQRKRVNYAKGKLSQQAHAVVVAWERRKAEIRRAMNGVK